MPTILDTPAPAIPTAFIVIGIWLRHRECNKPRAAGKFEFAALRADFRAEIGRPRSGVGTIRQLPPKLGM